MEDRGYSTPCWIRKGFINNKGYGKVVIAGCVYYAHRAMYEQEVGLIPPGKELDHLCKQTDCMRPEHLEAVTHAENQRRGRHVKLTAEEVAAIRCDPRNHTEVARTYGVSQSHVSRIRRGLKWADP